MAVMSVIVVPWAAIVSWLACAAAVVISVIVAPWVAIVVAAVWICPVHCSLAAWRTASTSTAH